MMPESMQAIEGGERFLRTEAEVARAALSSGTVATLVPRLLEAIVRAQHYGYGVFWRVRASDAAVVEASCGEGADRVLESRERLEEPTFFGGMALRNGSVTFCNRWPESEFGSHPVDIRLGAKALLAVPVSIREGRPFGIFVFGDVTDPERFSDRDVAEGVLLAQRIAEAIDHVARYAHARTLQLQYQVMTDSLEDAVFSIDTESRFTFANAAAERLTGYRNAELYGQSFAKIVAPTELRGLAERLRRALAGEAVPARVEVTILRKDGQPAVLELAVSNLVVDGHTMGRVGVARDITERKRGEAARAALEEQLRQAHKMEAIGRLAGGIAHDFNNMLTVIIGRTERILRDVDPDDPLYRHVALVEKTAERAAALTQQLLAFSRKQVPQPRVLRLGTVVLGMEKMLRRLIGEHIALSTVASRDGGWINGDPGQIEQVIMNLVLNARDAMPEGGRLLIEASDVDLDATAAAQRPGVTAGQYVELTIQDTGPGMSEETKAHLFEPFFTTKEPAQGTGLGLAIVYGVVTEAGGRIEVDSRLGVGTTFRILLPRITPIDLGNDPSAQPAPPQHGSETLLLVEDEADVRDLAREGLERHGYTVLEARNAREALRRAAVYRGPIDLLVTDVVMPKGNGYALATQLVARRPGLKVLFVSGYPDDVIERCGLKGLGMVLNKPFRAAALARAVREALDASIPLDPPGSGGPAVPVRTRRPDRPPHRRRPVPNSRSAIGARTRHAS